MCRVSSKRWGNGYVFAYEDAQESKGVPARRFGILLGVPERTGEARIATKNGVVKCRIVSRLSEDDQWNKEMILQMKDPIWEPAPGTQNMHIFADVDEECAGLDGEHERYVRPTETLDDEAPVEIRGSADKFDTPRKAITRYGVTVGCPGCNDLIRRGAQSGKINYHHSNDCRKRTIEHMKEDLEYRKLLEKHGFTVGMVQQEVLSASASYTSASRSGCQEFVAQ